MRKAILVRFVSIIILTLAVCSLVSGYFVSVYMLKNSVENMNQMAHVLEYALNFDKPMQENLKNISAEVFSENVRITIIDLKGNVVADTSVSDVSELENHLQREEVKAALQNGVGHAIRYSDTLKHNMLYVTRLSADKKYIIRLSEEYKGLMEFAHTLIPILSIGVMIALLEALFIGWHFSSEITKPIIAISRQMENMHKIEEDIHFEESKYEELNQITTSAQKMSQTIRQYIESLEKEKRIRQEFFSNASHELKTPITSIKGYTELLDQGFCKEEAMQKDFYKRILKETDNMTHLINDILMISRLEANENEEMLSEVRLCPLLQEIVDSMQPIAKEYQVTLHVECKPLCIKASPKQMRELILNLVSNGVKYNKPEGDVWVTIENQGNQSLLIQVRDNGTGISEEDQTRIFERFYRVDKGRSKKSGGTGLGLSIVKHVVEYNKGSIRLQSKIGEGSCFTIQLPVEILSM